MKVIYNINFRIYVTYIFQGCFHSMRSIALVFV